MGVSLALLRVASTLDAMAMAFRTLWDSMELLAIRAEPVIVAVQAFDRAFDVTLAYASPAMPTRSCPRKARWAGARKMDWP